MLTLHLAPINLSTLKPGFGPRFRLNLSIRSLVTIGLMVAMVMASVSPAVASSSLAELVTASKRVSGSTWAMLINWYVSGKAGQEHSDGNGIKPPRPESKTEREQRAVRLEINPQGDVVLQAGQPLVFTAIPVDQEGAPVHGLQAEWESGNHLVVAIKKTGQATAGKPGRANLTARAGRLRETIQVTVVAGERFGGIKPDSDRAGRRSGSVSQPALPRRQSLKSARVARLHHSPPLGTSMAPVPLRPPGDDPLPDSETSSLYKASNAVGSPLGMTIDGAPTKGAAALVTETNGSKNFTFGLPVLNMSGRGLGVNLSLVYNSLVWHKSTDSNGDNWMTYDVDSGWPATGWRISLGQIESQGSHGFTLTEPDGSRHALTQTSAYNYDTTDGSFIHYWGAGGWGQLSYPDGTVAYYGAGGGGYRLYPTEVVDRNGNYILISYAGSSGAGPKISSIVDTLGRYAYFYYASNGDLIAITQPGLGTSTNQTMRFYYTDVTIGSSLFGSTIAVSGPSSVHTLQYVYLPQSSDGSDPHVGYKFDYSPYGMVRQITEYRGMTVSSTSTSSAGSVSTEGSIAAQTTYGYPTSGSSLTDAPTYSTRTDDWAGRTTGGSAPQYSFSTNETTGVSTVTAPDGTINETHSIVNGGQWDDGYVSDTYVKDSTTTYSRTHMKWERDSNNLNPRISEVLSTNSVAGITKAKVFSYTSYNNVSVESERDFSTSETVPSTTELRRTETTYVTSSNYTARRLLHLPSMVQVFPGGSSTPVSRVDYAYDNYGTSHASMTARDDIIMHYSTYDPFAPSYETQGDCIEWDYWQINCLQWNYYWTSDYDPATDYRGNVTSLTTYTDAANASGSITHATTYDIAGNVMTVQADCCQLKSFTYSGSGSSGNHDYAYVSSETRGNPSGTYLSTSATYDYNTGLVDTTTDENGQPTTNYYYSNSLRPEHVTFPSGVGYLTYSDGLSADGGGKYYSYVEAQTKLDTNGSGGATRYVINRRYFDGRGALARTMNNQTSSNGWTTQDIEYNAMGRAYRTSNPYYASAYSATPASTRFWTTTTFDQLDRSTQVTMPTGDDSTSSNTSVTITYDGSDSSHNGIYATATDQAGKTRRQKVDALGRLVRLDEPTTSGLGTNGSPNQPTYYYYDALDNLVRINQPGSGSVNQDRYFKYDSLSRMIRERQVEQDTNSSYNLSDSLTGNSSWSRKIEYNSNGLVTDFYDPRGIHSTYSYDDLNRVTTVSYSDSTPTLHYYYDSQSLPSGAPSYTHSNTTGRLLAITYASGATGSYFAYDVMGRVVTQKQVTGSTTYGLSYTYNYAGLLTGETYPSGRALTYSYDEGGRLSGVGDGTTTFVNSISYSAHGGLTSETWGNSAVHAMSYNRRLQASQISLSLGSTTLQQFDYGYGEFNTTSGAVDTTKNNGQIGKVSSTIGTTAQWNQGLSYDELGRLSNLSEHQGSSMTTQTYAQGYTYDRYGNRRQSANTTLGLLAVSDSEINSSRNRLIETGSTATTYDAAGDVTRDLKFRGMDYTYDANGRMTTAERTDDTGTESSVYDGSGRRVRTSANGVTRTMVYDTLGQLVAEYLGSSGATLERENIYRGGVLLAVYEGGGSCKTISAFVTQFYQGVLHRAPSTGELNAGVTALTQAQSQGQSQLIAAAQKLGSDLFALSEYTNTNAGQFVDDLYWSYLQRTPDTSGHNFWTDQITVYGSTWANVRHAFEVSGEFQELIGTLCTTTSSTSASLKYLLPDVQGTTRTVMNNNGSSSVVLARHDYLPFGEELWAGIGLRTATQTYGSTDAIRQKYGMVERDQATGLDHSTWRAYESTSGRWTSPDPLRGKVENPQSFNSYAYVLNDPVNFIDPNGLMCIQFHYTNVNNPSDNFWTPWYCTVGSFYDYDRSRQPAKKEPVVRPTATPPLTAIQAALGRCMGIFRDLNGNPAVCLLKFDPSSQGHGGSATVDYIDHTAPGRTGVYEVKNNVTNYSYKTSPQHAAGYTNPASPFTNYTISDRNNYNAFDTGLQSIVGGFISTQIHELGNSIDSASGNYSGKTSAADPDSGYQLELCVEKDLRGQGYNGH